LRDGGDDLASDRRDDLTDDRGHNKPDNIGGQDGDRGAEEDEGERGGAKNGDLHETTLLNDRSYEVGERVVPEILANRR
jgi:hypothetical protein